MASPWGNSWGNSWGTSWGEPTPTITGDPWGNSWGDSWGSSWGRTETGVRADDPWGGSWGDSWGESWRLTSVTGDIDVVLTGTVIGAEEPDIVAGGRTIVLTLTGDTWVTLEAFNSIRQDILDGMTSASAQAHGWNNTVRDLEVVSAVARTSDTVVTITLSPAPSYSISANETITVTVPVSALETAASQEVAVPTFTIAFVTEPEPPIEPITPRPPDRGAGGGGPGAGGKKKEQTKLRLPPDDLDYPEDEETVPVAPVVPAQPALLEKVPDAAPVPAKAPAPEFTIKELTAKVFELNARLSSLESERERAASAAETKRLDETIAKVRQEIMDLDEEEVLVNLLLYD